MFRDRPQKRSEEAIDWLALAARNGIPDAQRPAFHRWLAEPGNKAEFEALKGVWDDIGALANHPRIRSEILAARSGRSRWRKLADFAFRPAPALSAAVVVTVAIVVSLLVTSSPDLDRGLYRTAVGEQKELVLSDGSTILLNTNTSLSVKYSPGRRRVDLLDGQVLVTVAHDASRPFILAADGTTVQALGTKFDVRKNERQIIVGVLEGRVRVSSMPHAGSHRAGDRKQSRREAAHRLSWQEVSASEQMIVDRQTGKNRKQVIDTKRIAAWSTGRVEFVSKPMADVVAELNRYSTSKIVLADQRTGDILVSGTFRIGNIGNFVEALEKSFSLEVRHLDDGTIMISQATAEKS